MTKLEKERIMKDLKKTSIKNKKEAFKFIQEVIKIEEKIYKEAEYINLLKNPCGIKKISNSKLWGIEYVSEYPSFSGSFGSVYIPILDTDWYVELYYNNDKPRIN